MKQALERKRVAQNNELPVLITEEARKFVQEVIRHSGERVDWCYQCGKCTAGCLVAFAMDIEPSRILRLVQLGQEEKVLKSKAIWLCVGCQTCTTRCPQEIDTAKIMDTLREMAFEKGLLADRNVASFFRSFLDNIRRYGRVFEPTLVLQYNFRSGHLLQDIDKAPLMFSKGKLPLLPPRKNTTVKHIFEALEGSKR